MTLRLSVFYEAALIVKLHSHFVFFPCRCPCRSHDCDGCAGL